MPLLLLLSPPPLRLAGVVEVVVGAVVFVVAVYTAVVQLWYRVLCTVDCVERYIESGERGEQVTPLAPETP